MADSSAVSERSLVLVVDDSPACVHLASGLLGNLGYQCFSATTFSQACQLAQEHRPGLALIDLVMPEGNGALLSAELHTRLPQIKTFAVSANYPVDLGSPAYACGQFAGALGKPLSIKSLRDLLSAPGERQPEDEGLRLRLASLPEQQRGMFLSALIYDLDDVQQLLGRASTNIQLVYCAHRLVGIFAAASANEIEAVKAIEQRLKREVSFPGKDLDLLNQLIASVRAHISQVVNRDAK